MGSRTSAGSGGRRRQSNTLSIEGGELAKHDGRRAWEVAVGSVRSAVVRLVRSRVGTARRAVRAGRRGAWPSSDSSGDGGNGGRGRRKTRANRSGTRPSSGLHSGNHSDRRSRGTAGASRSRTRPSSRPCGDGGRKETRGGHTRASRSGARPSSMQRRSRRRRGRGRRHGAVAKPVDGGRRDAGLERRSRIGARRRVTERSGFGEKSRTLLAHSGGHGLRLERKSADGAWLRASAGVARRGRRRSFNGARSELLGSGRGRPRAQNRLIERGGLRARRSVGHSLPRVLRDRLAVERHFGDRMGAAHEPRPSGSVASFARLAGEFETNSRVSRAEAAR